ncbi:glutathione S-transferase family protein [Sandaracinobacteroides saxicola]|uniref:Glutathione S-transferase family protein n=1 Tax=Sandaracinobacteroides saxicola TaxID=2759707 RepID=A0A7G5IJC0_9SPHN|nr:glutathione S-transferase family protein [Sandaracinobacteroides saxicola]QMW23462.1 glutathione S-transferase family protein [Sandaracinobacteroides saxicola]
MLKLWHCADARSFRALWALEEMGLPYELMLLPFPPRYRAPDYLSVNPLGTIPFFTDGEAAMTESAGIVHYLVTKHGPTPLAVDCQDPDYAAWLNFLHQSDATLTFPQTITFRYRVLEPPEKRQPKVAEDYAKWFLARTLWVDRALADGREWLCAGRFTAADIAVGYAFLLAGHLGLIADVAPGIRAWWDRCQARPAFARAKLAQG